MSVYKIAGVRPADIGLMVMRGSDRPILPGTRDRLLVISGRHGVRDFGADLEARNFGLKCRFITRSPAALQYAADTLAQLLVDAYGRPKTVDLIFNDHKEQTFKVRYSGSLPIDRLVGMGDFTLPLVAYDPFARGPEILEEMQIMASPFSKEILSSGNIRTEPVIVVTNNTPSTLTGFIIKNEYQIE
ncbi:distal tail protein Dit [Paenibacillus sp. sgz500958]|uniref:distal tail protein Dit n=1 Tax=Paenibacillus sp. sgz500958 TaxID=3242475 RepID=UPI0036D2FB50